MMNRPRVQGGIRGKGGIFGLIPHRRGKFVNRSMKKDNGISMRIKVATKVEISKLI